MKFLVVLVLLVAAVFAADDMLAIDHDLIKQINSRNDVAWVAGENEIFKGKTLSQVRHLLGGFLTMPETTLGKLPFKEENYTMANLPDEFDSRTQWPQCIHEIRDQGRCGSCWAFASSEALSDRFCIASKGSINHVLSPQDMVSCDKQDYGCQGGYLDKLWQYLENYGVVTDSCFPYTSGQAGQVPACPTTCQNGEKWQKFSAKKGSTKKFANVQAAMTELVANGPMITGFQVYRDFLTYKSGVYHHVSGGFLGGHAVKIIGYGKDSASGMDYWLVANSWSTTWGDNGLFKILKGKNECGFDSQIIVGQADV